MENKYPHIFSPLTVGNVTYKNRIFSAPATAHLLQDDGEYPTEATIAYYANKAKGGTANINVASMNMDLMVDPPAGFNNMELSNPTYHRYWQKLTDAIHFHGAKAGIELLAFIYHGCDSRGNSVVFAPSDRIGPDGALQPAISPEAMDKIADTYADAAENAVKCGFDSILIHGGHGVFISRMLSPMFNKREDEYGGSLENRAKFPIMILDRIRQRVKRNIIIEYRISGSELAPAGSGGMEVEDTIAYLKMIEDKIDIAHISAGNLWIPKTEGIMHPTNFLQPGCNAYLAEAVKKSGIKLPILTLGAFQDPELIEKTLAEGKADIVSMARGTIADCEVPNKARDGKSDEIIPCIKCFWCLNYVKATAFACSVNPEVGRESILPGLVPPVGAKKKVVIIGGGPSGMQAAVVAKKRGHDVVIYERANHLGGKLIFSEQVDFKYDLKKFMNYLIHMVDKLGVVVKLGVEATPEMITAEKADVVLAAVGANAIVPPIKGVDSKNVMIAEEAYNNIDKLGKSIAVLGGGQVGCETALHLANLGKKVSIVEMLPELAPDAMNLPREAILERIEEKVATYTKSRCTGITETGLTYVDADGKEGSIEAETIILAAGMRPRFADAEKFRPCAKEFFAIGDCTVAKNVRTATRTAYDAAVQL